MKATPHTGRTKHPRVPSRRTLAVVAAVATAVAVVVVVQAVDVDALEATFSTAVRQPAGLVLAAAALLTAFTLRAVAWCRVLPGLSVGHALAAIHLTMGANHVLPFRLGEPLRVVSVTRRTGRGLAEVASSTVALRLADVVSLAALGVLASPAVFGRVLGPWGAVAAAVAAIAAGFAFRWVAAIARRRDAVVRRPGAGPLAMTAAAWLCEAVAVWQALHWAGVDVGWRGALVVTAVAVGAQVAAVTPGGFGTYEAAAVAALAALGVDPGVALAAAIGTHALKTTYSLVAGAVAVVVPAPGLLGRLRLPPGIPTQAPAPAGAGPVVLFLPAHDEEAAVADVVRRAPASVARREVRVVVVDDGSTDATAERAAAAGATVVRSPVNEGLGAAVRRGLRHAVEVEGASVAVFCDADGEYAPEELEQLVAPIADGGADYVVGSRFAGDIEHMRPHRRLGNRVLTGALRVVARTPITDGQSGYRALSARAAADAEIVHDYNYAQVLTLDLLGKGYRYVEVPIRYRFRSTGRSFVRLGRYLRRCIPAVHRELNAPSPVRA